MNATESAKEAIEGHPGIRAFIKALAPAGLVLSEGLRALPNHQLWKAGIEALAFEHLAGQQWERQLARAVHLEIGKEALRRCGPEFPSNG